jgi:hypothetical protein
VQGVICDQAHHVEREADGSDGVGRGGRDGGRHGKQRAREQRTCSTIDDRPKKNRVTAETVKKKVVSDRYTTGIPIIKKKKK